MVGQPATRERRSVRERIYERCRVEDQPVVKSGAGEKLISFKGDDPFFYQVGSNLAPSCVLSKQRGNLSAWVSVYIV